MASTFSAATPSLPGFSVIVLLATTACETSAERDGGEENRHWGRPVQGQVISAATKKAEYSAGEPIILNIQIWNAGNEDVPVASIAPFDYELKVLLAGGPHVGKFDGRDRLVVPSGGLVPYTLYGRREFESSDRTVHSGILKAGDRRTVEIDLTRCFDMSLDGKYTISATRNVWQSGTLGRASNAASNTLEITVKDAPFFRRVRVESAGNAQRPEKAPVKTGREQRMKEPYAKVLRPGH